MVPERAREDPDLVTRPELAAGYLDRSVALAGLDLGNDGVGDLGWMKAIHHQADHARTPTGGVPLQPNEQEGVTGEKRRLALPLTPAPSSPLT